MFGRNISAKYAWIDRNSKIDKVNSHMHFEKCRNCWNIPSYIVSELKIQSTELIAVSHSIPIYIYFTFDLFLHHSKRKQKWILSYSKYYQVRQEEIRTKFSPFTFARENPILAPPVSSFFIKFAWFCLHKKMCTYISYYVQIHAYLCVQDICICLKTWQTWPLEGIGFSCARIGRANEERIS